MQTELEPQLPLLTAQDVAIVDVDVDVRVDVVVVVDVDVSVVELVADEVTTGEREVLLKSTLEVVATSAVAATAVVEAKLHFRLIVPVPLGTVPANMLQSL